MQRPALRQDLRDGAAPRRGGAEGAAMPHARPAHRLIRLRRVLLATFVAGAVCLLLGFLWFLDAAGATAEPTDHATDGIVVLTGGADRVRTGLALLVEGRGGRLLVSGAHRDVTLADLAATAGQPLQALQARVTLGHSARSTRGNAAETAAWVRAEGITSLRLVTAGYHMPRATLELRRVLPPEVAVIPHPVMPPALREAGAAARLRTWTLLCGEYAKLIGAALGFGQDPAA